MKRAIALLNLGGPDSPEAVEPFLISLFSDAAILRVPAIIRRPLARAIARRRAPEARAIYAQLGGASPILRETQAQAAALESCLQPSHQGEFGDVGDVRVFIVMRHWHPRAPEVAREIIARGITDLLLLPLYPQYSITTTGSALLDMEKALKSAGYCGSVRSVSCYPTEPGFIAALAGGVRRALAKGKGRGRPKLLFSAHGLPERIVKAGDPYQWQVEQTAAALAAAVGEPDLDWTLCYQSRVGPLKWIGPETVREIEAAAAARRFLVVVPIAFVSEHSETLVELDINYRARAGEAAGFVRTPTVGTAAPFIEGLARLAREAFAQPSGGLCNARICPSSLGACPHK